MRNKERENRRENRTKYMLFRIIRVCATVGNALLPSEEGITLQLC